jgi:tetratricopeptide (TPR) repeat protein
MAQVRPPDLLWSLSAVGAAYAREASGEFQQAQDAYQRVIDAKPVGLSVEAYLGKGRAAEQRQDVETAIEAYAAVLDRFPARAGALGLQDKIEVLKAHR